MEQKNSEWNGGLRTDFTYSGRSVIMVAPREPAPGRPWVWRVEYFGAFAQADIEMLRRGYHVVWYQVSNLFGSPEAVQLMREFQSYAEEELGLAKQAILFGFSVGGLYSANYACRYPEKVACIYLDAPVLDIKSWPGGKGQGAGSATFWPLCLTVYGLTEETVWDYHDNPLDRCEALAETRIPVVLVAGDADRTVPYAENGEIFARRFAAAGGTLLTIVKPGCDHHPHSLDDPSPVADFLQRNTASL